jgi:hypothetical protein
VDPFSYLSVLVSIILGLGITQLLTGVGRVLNARSRVRHYWPVSVWVGLLLLIHVQAWWAMFDLRSHTTWTFPGFLVVLLLPIVLYLAAALVLPEFAGETPVDLRANYYAHARWFFGLMALVLVVSAVRPLALGDRRELNLDFLAHVVLFTGFAAAALTRSERYHQAFAAVSAVILTLYVALLFMQLR